jgi:hypothetical protein
VVLTPRRWRQVPEKQASWGRRWQKSPVAGESAQEAVKTIARGMLGEFRCDLTNACALYHYYCTRGYRAHRAPGIPCALKGRRIQYHPGVSRRGNAKTCAGGGCMRAALQVVMPGHSRLKGGVASARLCPGHPRDKPGHYGGGVEDGQGSQPTAFPTISCINNRLVPQALGRRRPIWYPASHRFRPPHMTVRTSPQRLAAVEIFRP